MRKLFSMLVALTFVLSLAAVACRRTGEGGQADEG